MTSDSTHQDSPDNPFEGPTLEPGSGKWPAPKHWGPLDVVGPIGRGASGEVYKANDREHGREVALKLVRLDRLTEPEEQQRFLQEARRLARIKHPNVLQVYGADRFDGRVGMWTELIHGETLEEHVQEHGAMTAAEVAAIGVDLCKALAAVHSADLIHRDVKTDNVMRDADGRVVLMDFSAVTESVAADKCDDAPGGTPLFMAPELLKAKDSGVATDIYSLGVVLYRLASGHHPVEAKSITDLVQKHYRDKPVPLHDHRPELPTALVKVIHQAIRRDPTQRFASAEAMQTALEQAQASLSKTTTVGDHLGIGFRRRRRPVLALAGIFLALAVTMGVWQPWVSQFTFEAELYRSRLGTEERLDHGGPVTAGDLLYLNVRGNQPMYGYVFAVGDEGTSLWYPSSAGSSSLERLTWHRLPGSAGSATPFWDVGDGTNLQEMLVVTASQPIPELDEALAAHEAQVTMRTLQRLRSLSPEESAERGMSLRAFPLQ